MTDYLTELFNVLVAFSVPFPFMLYPMWKTRSVTKRFVLIYIVCFTVLLSAALFVTRQYVDIDIVNIQIFKTFFLLPVFALPFITFRKKVWQTVFIITIFYMYATTYTGAGNFTAQLWFLHSPLLYSGLVSAATIIVTSLPLIIMLRRICSNSGVESATAFWRLAWIIPTSFSLLILIPGSFYTGSNYDAWFIIIRVMAYAMSLFICYMFDIVTRQISEAEALKHEAETAKQKAEFYRKTSHSLRTPLTVVSTNIQTAKRRPGEADELLDDSQREIMKMADIISDALKDYDKGAGE